MSLVTIKDNHLRFMGTNYFVGNAQMVHPGSYGKKATPVFGQNKIEVKAHLPASHLAGRIQVAGPFSLDTTQSSKSDFAQAISGSVKVIGLTVSQNDIYEELTHDHLKLVQLYVEEEAMAKAVNDSPAAIDNLNGYGADARIVHQEFVIVEATLATSFTSGTSYEVSADAAGVISIKAGGGTVVSGKDTLTLAPGTGLAYLLLNFSWNKGKTQIEKPRADEWGIN
jgi:hypothetical protein